MNGMLLTMVGTAKRITTTFFVSSFSSYLTPLRVVDKIFKVSKLNRLQSRQPTRPLVCIQHCKTTFVIFTTLKNKIIQILNQKHFVLNRNIWILIPAHLQNLEVQSL